jgi:hypothetical protein
MIRTTFPGGWYGDATPGGAYAVLFANSHVQTHQGPIPLPASQPLQSPLFLRVTDVGGFRCAGQSSSVEVPAAWEWTGAAWRALPPPCVGVSPLIYDLLGILHTSDGSIGSQGWRYCAQDGSGTGRLITGDQTYGPTSPIAQHYGVQGLFEYSPAGPDLWVGQAAYDGGGVQVWDGTTLRQLERGDCRFVRVQWAGEQVAITFTTPPQTVLIQTTLAELRALPPVEAPEPPEPTPEPPEPPDPPVPPEPPQPPVVRPYPPICEVSMTTEQGWLIGPGDKVLACDGQGRVSFDRSDLTDQDMLQLDPIPGDRRGTYRPVAHLDLYLTADGTKSTPAGNVCLQYYGATADDVLGPDGLPGWYQRWDVGVWDSGLVTALVPYIEQGADHGRPWTSASLTWVKK